MKFKENTFAISLVLFSILGLNSVLSWGRSPAVSPILEIPHNFPKNISSGNISGYNLSRTKVTSIIKNTSNYTIPVIRTVDLGIIALAVFSFFGIIGFFFLGNKKETERLNNVEVLRRRPTSKKSEEAEDEYKKAS